MKSQFHPSAQQMMMPNPSTLGQSGLAFGGMTVNSNFFQTQQSQLPPAAGGVSGSPQVGVSQVFRNSPSRAKVSQINWRNVNDLDLDEVRKQNDIETLESYLPNLLDSYVSPEEFERLKPEAIIKLLQICQMSLQYFDYTGDYLDNLQGDTVDEINKLELKTEEHKNYLKKSKRELDKMKQEIAIKKEALNTYKDFIKKRPQFKCHICANKFFQNEEYLDSHMKRRHQNVLPMNANHPNFAVMQNMVFAQQLQQERKEFERQQKLLLHNEKYQKDDMLDKLELILHKDKQEQMQRQVELQNRLKEIEQQQLEFLKRKENEKEIQQSKFVGLMQNMSKMHEEVGTLKKREVVIQQSGDSRETHLQDIQQKQKELYDERARIQQEQEEFEIQEKKIALQKQKQDYQKQEVELQLEEQKQKLIQQFNKQKDIIGQNKDKLDFQEAVNNSQPEKQKNRLSMTSVLESQKLPKKRVSQLGETLSSKNDLLLQRLIQNNTENQRKSILIEEQSFDSQKIDTQSSNNQMESSQKASLRISQSIYGQELQKNKQSEILPTKIISEVNLQKQQSESKRNSQFSNQQESSDLNRNNQQNITKQKSGEQKIIQKSSSSNNEQQNRIEKQQTLTDSASKPKSSKKPEIDPIQIFQDNIPNNDQQRKNSKQSSDDQPPNKGAKASTPNKFNSKEAVEGVKSREGSEMKSSSGSRQSIPPEEINQETHYNNNNQKSQKGSQRGSAQSDKIIAMKLQGLIQPEEANHTFNSENDQSKEIPKQSNKLKQQQSGQSEDGIDIYSKQKAHDLMNPNSSMRERNNPADMSSMNFDDQGFYNGSKGRNMDLQFNPNSLNKYSQSLGDSFQEQLMSNKLQPDKPRKVFEYEDSDEFF